MIFVGFSFNFRIRIHPNKKSEQFGAQLKKILRKLAQLQYRYRTGTWRWKQTKIPVFTYLRNINLSIDKKIKIN